MAKDASFSESLLEQHGALRPQLPGSGTPWLDELRAAGIERFRTLGLPTPKAEEWKYTNLRALERIAFEAAERPGDAAVSLDRAPSFLGEAAGHRLVFVNGRLNEVLSAIGSLPEGATLTGLAAVMAERADLVEPHLGRIADGERQPLLALNTAFLNDGPVLHVGRGVALERPVEVVFVAVGAEPAPAFHPRLLVVLEDGARATLVEHHVGLDDGYPYLANGTTEILVGDGAALRHYKMQDESPAGFHVNTLHARIGAHGAYDGFALATGARLSRNEQHLRLEGAHAEARLSGAYLMRGKQHVDNTTLIEHVVPDTTCREVFKGALDDKARAVFQGKLVVHRDAQRSDGHQLSRALLLSETAEADSKPELEIYADDVKCSHGSTTGSLDREALFYLRSRGLPYRAAQRLLVESFIGEVVEGIKAEGLRERYMQRVSAWLGAEGRSR